MARRRGPEGGGGSSSEQAKKEGRRRKKSGGRESSAGHPAQSDRVAIDAALLQQQVEAARKAAEAAAGGHGHEHEGHGHDDGLQAVKFVKETWGGKTLLANAQARFKQIDEKHKDRHWAVRAGHKLTDNSISVPLAIGLAKVVGFKSVGAFLGASIIYDRLGGRQIIEWAEKLRRKYLSTDLLQKIEGNAGSGGGHGNKDHGHGGGHH